MAVFLKKWLDLNAMQPKTKNTYYLKNFVTAEYLKGVLNCNYQWLNVLQNRGFLTPFTTLERVYYSKKEVKRFFRENIKE